MSLSTFYFKMLENGKEVYYKIEHKGSRVLNWEMSEQITDEDFKFD